MQSVVITMLKVFLFMAGVMLFVLIFILPVLTTLFTTFTGVMLPDSYYLLGDPNSGWPILIIDTILVSVYYEIRK